MVRTSRSARQRRRRRARRCSCCAPISFRRRRARCCSRRARCSLGRGGSLRSSSSAQPAHADAPRAATRASATAGERTATRGAAGARVLQRPRRLRRRRPRVRHDPRKRAWAAGAVDQRGREPVVRLPGIATEGAATPGRSTAARTSSRRGRTIPSATAPARRSTCGTRTPANCGDRPRCRSANPAALSRPRPGDTAASSIRGGGSPLELTAVRAARRSGEDLAPAIRNLSDRPSGAVGLGLCRMGARRPRAASRRDHRHRDIGETARCWRATLEPSFGAGSPLRPARAPGFVDGRPPRVPRPQRHARPSRGARGRPVLVERSAPASIRAGRCRRRSIPQPGADEIVDPSRRGGERGRRADDRKLSAPPTSTRRCAAVTRHWDDVLGAVQVVTPDRSMDMMLNGWLLYQTLACRCGRGAASIRRAAPSAFATSCRTAWRSRRAAPKIAREQILRAAARQFVEGDVQHWWLPPSGQGVRTRIADDRSGSPTPRRRVRRATGDYGILDETRSLPRRAALPTGEHDAFFEPGKSDRQASLFEHCARRARRSLPTGAHGLPLIGTGDWNDGMNRIGIGGKGESVWLAGSFTRR
jgi:hypothetical protein